MRRVFLLAVCLLAVRLGAADGEWTRSAEATFDSTWVRRGIERLGATIQPKLSATDGAWKVGAWAAVPFQDARRRELGGSAGYKHAFESGVTLQIDASLFHFGGARDGQPDRTTELAASFAFLVGPGRLEASYTRDLSRRGDIAEVGYAGEHALRNWGTFLNYRVYVGAMGATDVLPERSGARVADGYTYHGLDLTVPYRVGGQTVVAAGVHYAGTNGARPFWSPAAASSGAKVWLSLAASYEF